MQEKGADNFPLAVRAIFFGVYAVGVLIAIGVLGGAGDLMYLRSPEFHAMDVRQRELVHVHIYLRDAFLLVCAIANSAWLFFRLFAVGR